MSTQENIKIIKEAIALEKHGFNFYRIASEKAVSDFARELFEQFANEEKEHIEILEKQYKNLIKDNKWIPEKKSTTFQAKDIVKGLEKEFKDTDFDITAVYIAMNLEEKAEKYYREKMELIDDETGKKILKWLADWERGHLNHFHELNESLKEDFWYESGFWPVS